MSSDDSISDDQNRDGKKEDWDAEAEEELNKVLEDINEDQDLEKDSNVEQNEGWNSEAEEELNEVLEEITDEDQEFDDNPQPPQVIPPQVLAAAALPERKRGKFTREEDRLIRLGIENEGENWDKISKAYVLTRNKDQLKYHFRKYIQNQNQ